MFKRFSITRRKSFTRFVRVPLYTKAAISVTLRTPPVVYRGQRQRALLVRHSFPNRDAFRAVANTYDFFRFTGDFTSDSPFQRGLISFSGFPETSPLLVVGRPVFGATIILSLGFRARFTNVRSIQTGRGGIERHFVVPDQNENGSGTVSGTQNNARPAIRTAGGRTLARPTYKCVFVSRPVV